MQIAIPCLAGAGPNGVFDLKKPSEAYTFMQFLSAVGVNAEKVFSSWNPRTSEEPELSWRADDSLLQREISERDKTIVLWRDIVLEQRFVFEPVVDSALMILYHIAAQR